MLYKTLNKSFDHKTYYLCVKKVKVNEYYDYEKKNV